MTGKVLEGPEKLQVWESLLLWLFFLSVKIDFNISFVFCIIVQDAMLSRFPFRSAHTVTLLILSAAYLTSGM